MNERPLLEISDLRMYFPLRKGFIGGKASFVRAVDGVSFSINKGETLGLVGESGCGKTTVGRTILKLYEPTSGKIVYDGSELQGLNNRELFPFRKRMQMIFQDPYSSLDPRMTVGDIIMQPMQIHKLYDNAKGQAERARELLGVVGLKQEHFGRYPHEFSGGQRQRVGIARALAVKPEFIICDEPISALDVSIQAQVVNMLEELQCELGLTYLFISHDLSMVRHISHKVGVMYLGNLVEYGDTATIFSAMLHPYTKALFSAVPVIEDAFGTAREVVSLQGEVPSPINRPDGCVLSTRCPHVCNKCRKETPLLKTVTPGHMVACHFAQEEL